MTWTGVSATTLPLPERYNRGQQCKDLGGEYVKSATVWFVTSHQLEACDPAECQSFMNYLHIYSDDDFYVHHHTCYATNKNLYADRQFPPPFTTQCSSALTTTHFSDQRYNEHSMDSRLLCLHWQPLVRRPAHTGLDAKDRCPRNRKLSFRTLLYLVTYTRHVIRAIVQQASLSVLVNLSLFKFWMWKIVEASM
jgi:hypothetical protein